MDGAGLLVFAALNGEALARERGAEDARFTHPRVLFAVRPVEGAIFDDYLATSPGAGGPRPEWYWALLPWNALPKEFDSTVSEPPSSFDPGRYVTFNVELPIPENDSVGVSWVVNEFGEPEPDSRVWNDRYEVNREKLSLPDPRSFYLGPLPPILDVTS